MNIKGMNLFLSEDNIKKHLEHLHTMKLKYSILEKSIPDLAGKEIVNILQMRIGAEEKKEAIELLTYIKSHEKFFSSFTDSSRPFKCDSVSCEKLAYEIFTEAKEKEYGFIHIYKDRGRIKTCFSKENYGLFYRINPILTLDLYEHTYFSDYGFNKNAFLRGAITHLDFNKLLAADT
ncbi:MAG: hypothetical protein IJX97_05810 [Clostridia bacterium]|nr:hypothetical protein [Clostridia bacterium]